MQNKWVGVALVAISMITMSIVSAVNMLALALDNGQHYDVTKGEEVIVLSLIILVLGLTLIFKDALRKLFLFIRGESPFANPENPSENESNGK